jgi:4-hydroxybenzoate polyprenyltransferase
MVHQTSRLLLHDNPNIYLLCFVFFSTICSYSFHWWLSSHSAVTSPRNDWMSRNRIVHVSLFVIGLIGAGIFFYFLLPYWIWLLPAAVITFLYSAPKIPHKYFRSLRKIALGKTVFLSLVWMYVTTILPLVITEHRWEPPFNLFIMSRFFLIYAVCILFDYRDREDDRAAGIRSLITFLNEKGIRILFYLSLLVFGASTLALLAWDQSILVVAILLLPGIIAAFLYDYARRNLSDIFYYVVLDGLMALSSVLTLIPGI